MSKKYKYPHVRLGDVVVIELDHYPKDSPNRHFHARVSEIHDEDDDTKIRYERLDGYTVGMPDICHVHFIKRFLERPPYVVQRRQRVNVFSDVKHFSFKQGGYRIGSLHSLVCEALATVKNVDLGYPIYEDRIDELYARAQFPGKVVEPDTLIRRWYGLTVHWKTFRRWVHQNAARLIESKTENRLRIIEQDRRIEAASIADLDDEMARQEEEEEFFEDQGFDPFGREYGLL
jgi:hypothetical protein